MTPPKVLLTTDFEDPIASSAWTIFPLMPVLKKELLAVEDIVWVAIINENTEIDLKNLNEAVKKYTYNPKTEALFLGRGLKDETSTIVHHFDDFKSSGVVYPDLESGIFLSRKLVLDLSEELEFSIDGAPKIFPSDFNIDPSYEFAKFLYKGGSEEGVSLTHLEEVCPKKGWSPRCISYPRQMNGCLKSSKLEGYREVLSPQVTRVMVKT